MDQAPIFQRLDNAIHRINHYPADSVVCFVNTYPLDSDLPGGQRYPAFEKPGPGLVIAYCDKLTRTVSYLPGLPGANLTLAYV